MSILIRVLSGILTAIPAAIFATLIFLTAGNDYYWMVYYLVAAAFLVASFLIGIFLPAAIPSRWLRRPGLWLFGQGLSAWLVTLLVFGLLNLTPLCVGQDNGDGNNDLALCIVQTVLVSIVYSPPEFILLCLSALPGGWLVKRLIKSEAQ